MRCALLRKSSAAASAGTSRFCPNPQSPDEWLRAASTLNMVNTRRVIPKRLMRIQKTSMMSEGKFQLSNREAVIKSDPMRFASR
jgi:hypothetical protein